MQICRITEDILELYRPFIADGYLGRFNDGFTGFYGFFDDINVHGAAILEVRYGVAEIVDINYADDIEEGIFEKMFTELLVKNAKKLNIYRIVSSSCGDEDYLENRDYVMMNIGYMPREGDVSYYEARLSDVGEALKNSAHGLSHDRSFSNMLTAGQLEEHTLAAFNRKYFDTPYNRNEYAENLSIFYVREDEALAAIYAKKCDDGHLTVEWMNCDDEVTVVTRIYMMVAMYQNAEKLYPPDTRVVVCPFLEEVFSLVETLGFKKRSLKNMNMRIYTYYIDDFEEK